MATYSLISHTQTVPEPSDAQPRLLVPPAQYLLATAPPIAESVVNSFGSFKKKY